MKRLRVVRRWFSRRIGYARLLCLVLLIGFAALRVADPAPVEEIRVRTFDAFQRIDPRKKTARPVTIVDIDDKSLEKLGQWPWPRTRIADLITELTRLGAVVIAFDAVFSEPDRLNPAVVAAMAEWAIDLSRAFPKPLTDASVKAADVVITMGCGDACAIYPGKRYEDWPLPDPAGQPVEVVRGIRDQIDARVGQLLAELVPAPG